MRPKLIVGDRSSGRTTDLIRACAEAESKGHVSYIICHSQDEAYRIARLAELMELQIGFPITYDEFLHRSYHGTHIHKFFFDNLRMFLAHICKPDVEIDTVVW